MPYFMARQTTYNAFEVPTSDNKLQYPRGRQYWIFWIMRWIHRGFHCHLKKLGLIIHTLDWSEHWYCVPSLDYYSHQVLSSSRKCCNNIAFFDPTESLWTQQLGEKNLICTRFLKMTCGTSSDLDLISPAVSLSILACLLPLKYFEPILPLLKPTSVLHSFYCHPQALTTEDLITHKFEYPYGVVASCWS